MKLKTVYWIRFVHLLAIDESLEQFGVERMGGDFGSDGGGDGVVGLNLGQYR